MSLSLYEKLVAAGVPVDSHESDLYCQATNEARDIVKESGVVFHAFISQTDGRLWFDIPFMFEPWWEAKRNGYTRAELLTTYHAIGKLISP